MRLNRCFSQPQFSRLYNGDNTRYLLPRAAVKGFSFWWTEGRRFSSRDAFPCARSSDLRAGGKLAGGAGRRAGGSAGGGQAAASVRGVEPPQRHAQGADALQELPGVRAPASRLRARSHGQEASGRQDVP